MTNAMPKVSHAGSCHAHCWQPVCLRSEALPALCQKAETIEASAMGTGISIGVKIVEIRLIMITITPPWRRGRFLVDAFTKEARTQGLVTAPAKDGESGGSHFAHWHGGVPTLAFIRMIPTPTGRKLRVYHQSPDPIPAEAWTDSPISVL